MASQRIVSPEQGVAFLEFLIGALFLGSLLAFFMAFELRLIRAFRNGKETHQQFLRIKEELHEMLQSDSCSRRKIEAGIVRIECRKGTFVLSHYGETDEYP